MKLGVAYPTTEVAGDPANVRRFVRAAEELGYDYLMHYDHVVKAVHEGRDPPLKGPYTEKDSFHDPLVFFAFAAGLTDKLEFATGVLILPQRQTVLLAQQVADLDLFSNERFRLGVGVGWNYVEYDALGQDFHTRGKRIDEQIGFLRQLWAEPLVTFKGRFDQIDRAGINPRPKRQVPIWIGGESDIAYRRGAQLGDGFFFAGRYYDPKKCLARLLPHLREAGRDEASFGRELLAYNRGAEEGADAIKGWREVGGTHGCVTSQKLGLGSDIGAHIDHIAKCRRMIDAGQENAAPVQGRPRSEATSSALKKPPKPPHSRLAAPVRWPTRKPLPPLEIPRHPAKGLKPARWVWVLIGRFGPISRIDPRFTHSRIGIAAGAVEDAFDWWTNHITRNGPAHGFVVHDAKAAR